VVLGRYLAVGIACALLHNIIMIAADAVGMHYAASSIVSLVVVTAFGYGLHSRWTYPGAERGRESFTRYAVIVSANFPLSLAGLFVFVDVFAVPVPIAAPVVTVILFAFNYVANRWALRVKRRSKTTGAKPSTVTGQLREAKPKGERRAPCGDSSESQ